MALGLLAPAAQANSWLDGVFSDGSNNHHRRVHRLEDELKQERVALARERWADRLPWLRHGGPPLVGPHGRGLAQFPWLRRLAGS
jgi:hypothetical protein